MRILLLAVFIIVSFYSSAQYRWDFGANVGATNYLGEIGGGADEGKHLSPADLKINKTRYAAGAFARYKLKPFLSIKGNLNYLVLTASDETSSNYARRGRNLSFTNSLIEMEVVGQFFFLQINDIGGSYKSRNDIRFYGFAGVAAFYNNPKADYLGTKIALRPLKTEGVEYGAFGLGIPGGLGAYMTIQRIIRVGIEATYVHTFTDYIDDVSTVYVDPATIVDPVGVVLANRSGEYTTDESYLAQYGPGQKRGDPKYKDVYLYTAVTASYVLKGKSAFYKSKYGGLFGKGIKGFKKRSIRAKF